MQLFRRITTGIAFVTATGVLVTLVGAGVKFGW
jgi:hypothetical protein